MKNLHFKAVTLSLSCACLAMILTGCETSSAGFSSVEIASSTDPLTSGFELPDVGAVNKPRPERLGGENIWLTEAQSALRNALNGEQEPAIRENIKTYGAFYRKLLVTTDRGNWDADAQEFQRSRLASLDCTRRGSQFGQFIGSLVGYNKKTAATLTISVYGTHAEGGEIKKRIFIENFPVLTVHKNRKTCELAMNDADFTGYISPNVDQSLTMDFKVHQTNEKSINLTSGLSLISAFAGQFTQTGNDGVVGGIADIVSSDLNGKINDFLKNFDKGVTLSRVKILPLGWDNDRPYDQLILSFGRPINDESFNTLEFPNGPAFNFSLGHRASVFAACPKADITQCVGLFQSPDQVLDQSIDGQLLSALILRGDPSNDGKTLQTTLTEADDPDLDLAMRKANIAHECKRIKNGYPLPEYRALNKTDQLIFLYSLLAKFTDYEDEYFLNSTDCFSNVRADDEEQVLKSLGFRFPSPVVTAELSVDQMRATFSDYSDSLAELLTADATLAFLLPIMTVRADGTEIRSKERYRGKEAYLPQLERASSFDLIGSAFCHQEGWDRLRKQKTDLKFGLWYRLQDNAAKDDNGIAPKYAVPIIIERDASAPAFKIKKLSFVAPQEYFRELEPSPSGVITLAGVEEKLSQCPMQDYERKAVRELINKLAPQE